MQFMDMKRMLILVHLSFLEICVTTGKIKILYYSLNQTLNSFSSLLLILMAIKIIYLDKESHKKRRSKGGITEMAWISIGIFLRGGRSWKRAVFHMEDLSHCPSQKLI